MKKLLICLILALPLTAKAQVPPEILSIINNASTTYGVSTTTLATVINCESTASSTIVGDKGTSFGLVQVHLPAHPELTLQEALNPVWSVNYLAYNISIGNGKPWTCYNELASK